MRILSLLLLQSIFIFAHRREDDIPKTVLRDGQELPLVGIGVGNLQRDLIVSQITTGVASGIHLVDTAHASRNHHLVLQGLVEGLRRLEEPKAVVVHVVTKVWYTYLGYERTKLAVKEILEQLNHPNIRVHLLLHWPRCRDDISWMNCEQEEEALPQCVKEAGPPPHLDKENAFKESWRALEDTYLGQVDDLASNLATLESIGVSNFRLEDLKDLAGSGARIVPHILQDNVWTFLFDPYLIDYCHAHQIHYQAYNVMNGILSQRQTAPIAFDSLQRIAQDMGKGFQASQVILKWLIQQEVSVIPRTTNPQHLVSNSPVTLAKTRDLTSGEQRKAQDAAGALLRGRDLQPPQANFVNRHTDVLHLFWRNADGNEVPVKEGLQPGESFGTTTYPGHVFVAYDESKQQRREFTIQASYGEHEQFHIEEL